MANWLHNSDCLCPEGESWTEIPSLFSLTSKFIQKSVSIIKLIWVLIYFYSKNNIINKNSPKSLSMKTAVVNKLAPFFYVVFFASPWQSISHAQHLLEARGTNASSTRNWPSSGLCALPLYGWVLSRQVSTASQYNINIWCLAWRQLRDC